MRLILIDQIHVIYSFAKVFKKKFLSYCESIVTYFLFFEETIVTYFDLHGVRNIVIGQKQSCI